MKKEISKILIAALIISSTPIYQKTASAATDDVSVALKYYVGNQTSITFKVNGEYLIAGTTTKLTTNSYTIKKNNTGIDLYNSAGAIVQSFGTNFSLTPSNYDTSHTIVLSNKSYLGTMNFTNDGTYLRPTNTLPLDDYLKGVVPNEMSNSWSSEALKAQAVAARTYAKYHGTSSLDDTPNNQSYGGYYSSYTNSNAAVDATKGMYLTYGGKPIYTAYSSSNGGYVLSETNSWNSPTTAYLQFKKDPFDTRSSTIGNSQVNWNYTLHKQQVNLTGKDLNNQTSWWSTTNEVDQAQKQFQALKNYLASKIGVSTSNFKIIDISTLSFTSIEDVNDSSDVLMGKIMVNYLVKDQTVQKTYSDTKRTYDFRTILGDYTGPMKSPAVESVVLTNGLYTITGHGWGHGIGMSQWGAYEMAKEGYNYQQILGFYYPNTSITSSNGTNALPIVNDQPTLAVTNVTTNVINNVATINFQTNKSANVSVTIKDSSGNVIGTPKATAWETSGIKSVTYNAATLNGNYTYEIRVADGTNTVNKTGNLIFSYVPYLSPTITNVTSNVTNNIANLNFTTNKSGNLSVTIKDSSGNVIASPKETVLEEAGTKNISYDADTLNGIYSYEIRLSDGKEVAYKTGNLTFSYLPLEIKNITSNIEDNVANLNFEINKNATFSVLIKDSNGNIIATPKAATFEEAGQKNVTYNADTLNGDYYYEIKVDDDKNVIVKTGQLTFSYMPVIPLTITNVQTDVKNNVTQFSFETNKSGNVSIVLKDQVGNTVATPKEVLWETAGVKNVTYDAKTLNGIYNYEIRLADGKEIVYKKGNLTFNYVPVVPLSLTSVSSTVTNNVANIIFTTNKSANLTVTLKDSNGKIIATPKAEKYESAGKKAVTYNGSNLNGTYTYEIKAASGNETIIKTGKVTFKKIVSVVTIKTVYTTKTNLNLRSTYSSKGKVYTTIPKGKTVTYLSKIGSWYKVKYGSKTGWVSSSYIKVTTTKTVSVQSVAKSAPAPLKTYYTTTTNLNLRSTYSTKGKVYTTIPKGKAVTYLSKVGNWYKIKYGTKTGWVSSQYIKITKK